MAAMVNPRREEDAHPSVRQRVDALADTIAVHAARIDAATHELLTEIRRFDELGGWAWQGAKSCAHWLTWRIGLGPGAAAEKVRVARALGELPLIDAAFASGALSYCKVRAMTRVASPATEERLLEMARHATGAQLERICRGFRLVQRAAARTDEERRQVAEPDRWVQRRHTPDGMVRIEAQLLPDEAELVWAALERVRQELGVEVGKTRAQPLPEVDEASTEGVRSAEEPPSDVDGDGPLSAERGGSSDGRPERGLSAESRGDPTEPVARLGAAEPAERAGTRGTWVRCDETGELMYIGTDPPDVWPEASEPAQQDRETKERERARAQRPSRAEWSAQRASGALPDRVDALVALAERMLTRPPKDGSAKAGPAKPKRGHRPLLLVHLSEDRLAQGLGLDQDAPRTRPTAQPPGATPSGDAIPFVAQLHDGASLRGDTLLRLACDAGVSVVATDGRGAVLDIGRRQRTISPAILRALLVRDGQCRFPGCTAAASVEAHHIKHWAHGGETRLENLVLTCRFHHKALHEGGFSVERQQDGELLFRDARGRPLEPVPKPPTRFVDPASAESAVAELATEQRGAGVVIDRTTSLPRGDGTPLDLGAAVAGLWRRHERRALPTSRLASQNAVSP